ncbi:MAG: FHA domain-containing protein [Kiritimatiellae bacterium]|nr:FHA domain-containing protein [Kiritimatiellia bacterium]
MAVLIGMSGDLKGQTFQLTQDETRIGRSEDNAIPLNNPTVSGHHCSIHREGEKYILRDKDSTNGTRLNSREVAEAALKPKDLIQVGSVEFMFDAAHVEAVETSAYAEARVEVTPGPTTAPASFANISPFGGARKESKGLWFLLITVVGLLALAAVVILFWKLITAG